MGPQDDLRFDAVVGLGDLEKLYTGREMSRRTLLVVGFIGLMAIAVMIAVGGLIPGLIILALAALSSIFIPRRDSSGIATAALYSGGLAYHDQRKLHQVRWEDVLGTQEIQNIGGLEDSYPMTYLHVEGRDGDEIVLPADLADFHELRESILARLIQTRTAKARAAIDRGEIIYFGALQVDSRGIQYSSLKGEHFLGWPEVLQVTETREWLTRRANVSIQTVSDTPWGRGQWLRVPADQVADPGVFVAICRDFLINRAP